jgi:hypothetical protein
MIVSYFDSIRITFVPSEAYSPLIADADTVLPLPIARQPFKAIAGGDPQIIEIPRSV